MASGHPVYVKGIHVLEKLRQPASTTGHVRTARASSVHFRALPQPPEAPEAAISESTAGSKLMRKLPPPPLRTNN